MNKQTDKSILNENKNPITVNAIFAVGKNGEMGNDDGSLPWRKIASDGRQVLREDLPEEIIEQAKNDMEIFKRLTTGNIVIMGYNTYKTFSAPLPNRVNIVIDRTYDTYGMTDDVTPTQQNTTDKTSHVNSYLRNTDISGRWLFVRTLEDAIKLAEKISIGDSGTAQKEIFIIGGAKILHEAFQKKIIEKTNGKIYKTVINADFPEATVRFS